MKWLLIAILLISSVFAANSLTEMNVVVIPDIPSTTFDYDFVFSDSASCGVLLNVSKTITTNPAGRGNATLDLTGLTDIPAYLCTYRDDVLKNKQSLNRNAFEQGNLTSPDGQTGYVPVFSTASTLVKWILSSQLLNTSGFDAANITSGTLSYSVLPTLTNTHLHTVANLSDVTNLALTHTHDATNITSGTLADARITSAATWNSKGSSNLTISDINTALGNATAVSLYAGSLGNWSGNISLYTTTANLVSALGNWSADKSSYATTTTVGSIGNWSGNMSHYIIESINYTTAALSTGDNVGWNLTSLALTLDASSTYLIDCRLITRAALTATGVQFRVNTTGAPTTVDVSLAPYGSVLGYNGVNAASNTLSVLTSTVTYNPSTLTGYVVTAGATSRWTIEYKSEIGASLAYLNRGSWCNAKKVA